MTATQEAGGQTPYFCSQALICRAFPLYQARSAALRGAQMTSKLRSWGHALGHVDRGSRVRERARCVLERP